MVGLILTQGLAQQSENSKPSDSRTATSSKQPITMIVTDPMSSKLSCDCVQGYAQRDYEKLGYYLSSRTARPVHVVFGETFADALEESKGRADIVVGKYSVIREGAKKTKLELKPAYSLTDKQDSTSQTGLFVVRAKNAAQTVRDLSGYRILYGPTHCDEKYAAPRALLKSSGVEVIAEPPADDICSTCSVAAKTLMELGDDEKVAGVISSYALRLLEGCGNIQKGDLRVIGESQPVPFITVFLNDQLSEKETAEIGEIFQDVELEADLLEALETGSGFIPWQESENKKVGQLPQDNGTGRTAVANAKKKS